MGAPRSHGRRRPGRPPLAAAALAAGSLAFVYWVCGPESAGDVALAVGDPWGGAPPRPVWCTIVPPGEKDPAPLGAVLDGEPVEMWMRGRIRTHAWPRVLARCPGMRAPLRVLDGSDLLETRPGEPDLDWSAPGARVFWTACKTVYEPVPAHVSLAPDPRLCPPPTAAAAAAWWAGHIAAGAAVVAWWIVGLCAVGHALSP